MTEHLPVIHQQDGAITLAEFAGQHNLTSKRAIYLANRGSILGATKIRNGRWMVYPPAVLLEQPFQIKRSAIPGRVAPPSGASDIDSLTVDAVTYPIEDDAEAAEPLHADTQQLEAVAPSAPVSPYKRADVQAACLLLRKAVARQDKNVYRLRLEAVEIVQLVEAVASTRRKLKQAISKGAKQYGELKATDALWHKLNAVMNRCRYEVQS